LIALQIVTKKEDPVVMKNERDPVGPDIIGWRKLSGSWTRRKILRNA
jgi:hypothetical protein